jgi:hypothetical protein
VDRGSGFQGPAGESVVSFPEGPALALLDSASAPWPAAPKQGHVPGYEWLGYELDAKRRPTLLYAYAGVEVRDAFEPIAGPHPSFRRTLTLAAASPPGNLWFRAAIGKPACAIKVDGSEEMVVPVRFRDGKAQLVLTYGW